jgi:energy-coupling factor transporter ATP-binding protein EcfA2
MSDEDNDFSASDILKRVKRRLGKIEKRKRGPMKNAREPRNYDPMKSDYNKKYRNDLMKGGSVDYIEDFKGAIEDKEVFLASSSLNDHYITKYVDFRYHAGLDTQTVSENLVTDPKAWLKYVHGSYDSFQKIEFGSTTGMIIDNENLNFIDYTVNSNSVEVRLYGSKEFIEKEYDTLKDNFSIAKCHIEWVYAGDGSSVTIPLLGEKLPVSEMYPFLKDETIEEYYDRYLDSSASILLLIGPPGTGKTTFIRGLLHHASKNAIVTYDDKILERDYIFARFLEDDSGVMVIEDADNFLKPRSDGNTMMHRFLNVGDGLISIRGKKLIFSTNLPSIRDVDSALVRPGRCFDVVSFDNYNLEQATKLAKKLGVTFEEKEDKKDTYSLAEIFFKQKNSSPKQVKKMGFV